MAGIKDRVAIIGMGCTQFGEMWNKGTADLIIDAAKECCEDAGVDLQDIPAAWVGTQGSGVMAQTLTLPLKMQYKPVTRIENMCATASDALRNACYAVAAGIYPMALALGVEKLKDTGMGGLGGGAAALGIRTGPSESMPGQFAMMATRYFAQYKLSPEEGKKMIGMVSVKSHANGVLSPKAHLRRPITLEQVLSAPIIAWPLGLFDCCGVSDGSAAAIVVRAEDAKKFRPDPVYIKAMSCAVGPITGRILQSYDYTHVEEGYRAGIEAYREAEIKNPREEVSMAEVHDCFSITEAVTMEDLQFSPRGKVKDDIESGFFTLEGGLPVQTDGGLKCFGHPIGASGLRMIYEMYKQLQGKADKRQIKNPKLGLTHNMGGQPAGCIAFVSIVGL